MTKHNETISYEEDKIKKMVLLDRFSKKKKSILKLLSSAKKDTTSPGGAIFGIYLSMTEQLSKAELKIIFPERYEEPKEEWYCWHCGDKLGENIMLWSLSRRADRVFMVCSKKACQSRTKFG